MNYLVVEINTQLCAGETGDEVETDVRPHMCDDTPEIANRLRGIEDRGRDWAIFENQDGRLVRRSVVMKKDGKYLYDVVIQRYEQEIPGS